MGRDPRGQNRFRPTPVQRVELNEDHLTQRLIAAGVILVIGAALLAYSVMRFMAPPSGWQYIQANGTGEASCAEELTFLYDAGSSAEAKVVTDLYTSACQKAYRLFHSQQGYDGVVNVYEMNRRPNEVLTVDAALYTALSTVTANGRRELYLGPVYARYSDLFFCQDDAQLVNYDPRLSEDVAREYQTVLAYANDPRAVEVELLGENQVRLRVSEEYLAYAEREGVERLIDFGWMRSAFVVDLLASELAAGGYTKGVVSSYDGFSRNLDAREGTYDYPLYHRRDDGIHFAADMCYRGPVSLVCLRDFPTSEQDLGRFYTLRSGEVRTVYLDAADALCKCAVSSLVCYSREMGCGQMLMEMIPAYIADTFQPEAASTLAARDIQSVYCEGTTVFHTDPQIVLTDLAEEGGVFYTAELVES